jgi:hypothetical protein
VSTSRDGGSPVPTVSKTSEIPVASNGPNAEREASSENTPLLVVSVLLMLILAVLFAILMYKEHGQSVLLERMKKKKEALPNSKT